MKKFSIINLKEACSVDGKAVGYGEEGEKYDAM